MKFIVYFPLTPLKLYTNKKALEAAGPQPLLLVPAFKGLISPATGLRQPF